MAMDRVAGGILVLVLGLSLSSRVNGGELPAVPTVDHGQAQPPAAPAQQHQALLKGYNDAFDDYTSAFREARLPEDRQKVIQEKYPRPGQWAAKFLELAEKNPTEPFAEEALIWIVSGDVRLKRFL